MCLCLLRLESLCSGNASDILGNGGKHVAQLPGSPRVQTNWCNPSTAIHHLEPTYRVPHSFLSSHSIYNCCYSQGVSAVCKGPILKFREYPKQCPQLPVILATTRLRLQRQHQLSAAGLTLFRFS